MFQGLAIVRGAGIGVLLAFAMLLAGCAGGIELEGPGFERLGLTSNKNKGEAKVPDRAPLVLPPDKARLPQPQADSAVAAAPPQNWPVDPDTTREEEAIVAAKEKREYEDKGDWSGKGGIDEFEKLSKPDERKTDGALDRLFKKSQRNN